MIMNYIISIGTEIHEPIIRIEGWILEHRIERRNGRLEIETD